MLGGTLSAILISAAINGRSFLRLTNVIDQGYDISEGRDMSIMKGYLLPGNKFNVNGFGEVPVNTSRIDLSKVPYNKNGIFAVACGKDELGQHRIVELAKNRWQLWGAVDKHYGSPLELSSWLIIYGSCLDILIT